MSEPRPIDLLSRPLHDLRISVTDRCNFRCPYCMPKEVFGADFEFLRRREILSYEEIARLVRLSRPLGVRKVRLTGGEPLMRRDLPKLIEMLRVDEDLDLALTTNGALLTERAAELAEAGLDRVTVSLDSLDDATFKALNDVDFPVSRVLDGIERASEVGLRPVKINAVVVRGVNDESVLDLARRFKGSGHILRFIEYMDVGTTNGWELSQVVPAQEIIDRISAELALVPLEPSYRGEVARRWQYEDGDGEVGVIASVTSPFCGDCTRARLSADGRLYTCLFAKFGTDLKGPLRDGSSDEDLSALLTGIWQRREDRYSEERTAETAVSPRVEMSYIGG